jgi:superoxide dismutase, Cu-Zn family
MRPTAHIVVILLCSALTMPLAWGQEATQARAGLYNPQGEQIGTATVIQGERGPALIRIQVSKLPPGAHGLHIHAVGQCDPPDFQSAGDHLNPFGKKHGHKNPDGAHAGDLPNLVVGPDGAAEVDVPAAGIAFGEGPHSPFATADTVLVTPGSAALVIHAQPDDEGTDPDGKSGPRIACGVFTRGR